VVLEGLDYLQRCRGSDGAPELAGWTNPRQSRWILPRAWRDELPADCLSTLPGDALPADPASGLDVRGDAWVVVTDGRFATCLSHQLVARVVAAANADVIAVNAAPDLRAYRERVRLTPNNELVGYRRLFADSAAPIPMPADWPHHLLARRAVFEAVVRQNLLGSFETLMAACRTQGLRVRGIAVAGSVFDLESETGILAVCRAVLELSARNQAAAQHAQDRETRDCEDPGRGRGPSRLIGPVVLGRQVTIEPGAVIVGPTILCDGCTVSRDAVVDSCVVGAGVSVEPERMLRGRLAVEAGQIRDPARVVPVCWGGWSEEHACAHQEDVFRSWPKFSYARYGKRVADAVAAVLVLILFAPVIPVIALAIRINSPGPVFFRHKRQGLHGIVFDCIKFRTMRPGADKMQEKLRFVCEVDGPQFKMADDPRITAVGRFLRETYLDEIPQFFNVLCGQMSVVGPRPSPEFENTLCPSWRDARLSVRPGITGLWQVCRTRAAHKDFQEWIHYDTQYVRDLAPGLDLWICWRTFRRMVENFVTQF
jgi:lipopolysaccharide/colanic/teichoic acid biosynthesis glycosyltransferase